MMMRWDPFRDVAALQRDINRLFDPSSRRENGFGDTRFPLMDVSETEDGVMIRALVPAMSQDDVKITLFRNVLTISGEKRAADLPEGARALRVERSTGHFERTFRLNRPVDEDKISAHVRDGVLTLTLPLKAEAKPRQISLSVG